MSRVVNGKRERVKVYGKTKSEALTLLRQRQMAVAEKRVAFTDDKQTVGAYVRLWLDSLEVAPSTMLRYNQDFKNHIKDTDLAKLRMSEIEPTHVLGLYSELKTSKTISTRRKIHTLLHAAFESAQQNRIQVGFLNPCNLAKNQKPKYERGDDPKPLDAVKEGIFLKAIDGEPYEALFILALDSGMRQGELFALEWKDIDWNGSTIEVARTLKDTADGLDTGPTKGRQRRAIKVSSMTMDALKAHRRKQARSEMQTKVFPDRDGGYIRRQNFNRRAFATALQKAQAAAPKVDFSGHTFHDLRHTMASLLLQEGESITRVSQRLGHKNVSTTWNFYASCLPTDEERPAMRFENRRREIGSGIGSGSHKEATKND